MRCDTSKRGSGSIVAISAHVMPLAYGPLVQLETFVFLQIIFFQTNIIHGNPSSQCQAKEIEDLKQRLESQDWQVQELEMQVDILKKALEQADSPKAETP